MPRNPEHRPQEETVAMPEFDAEELMGLRPFVQFPAPPNATGQAKAFYHSGRLNELLEDVECGPFEGQRITAWFWRESPSWIFNSQAEFSRHARYRLRRFIKESRKLADAGTVVSRLFDRTSQSEASFIQAMAAINLLAPTEPMPKDIVEVHGKIAYVDLTKRSDHPRILTVDTQCLPIIRGLWPFEWSRETESVIKQVPVGGGIVRSIPLVWIVFWAQHRADVVRDDLMAVVPRNCDWLDMRADNLAVDNTPAPAEGIPDVLTTPWEDADEERREGKNWPKTAR